MTASSTSPCLVPRPLYFVAVELFRVTWSEEKVRLGRSSRIRHRNGLTVKAWEKAVQEQGKTSPRVTSVR